MSEDIWHLISFNFIPKILNTSNNFKNNKNAFQEFRPLQWPSGGGGGSAPVQGGICLPGGGGVSAPVHAGIHPPCEQNDWQTGVKTLPCRNYVADGKYLP